MFSIYYEFCQSITETVEKLLIHGALGRVLKSPQHFSFPYLRILKYYEPSNHSSPVIKDRLNHSSAKETPFFILRIRGKFYNGLYNPRSNSMLQVTLSLLFPNHILCSNHIWLRHNGNNVLLELMPCWVFLPGTFSPLHVHLVH